MPSTPPDDFVGEIHRPAPRRIVQFESTAHLRREQGRLFMPLIFRGNQRWRAAGISPLQIAASSELPLAPVSPDAESK